MRQTKVLWTSTKICVLLFMHTLPKFILKISSRSDTVKQTTVKLFKCIIIQCTLDLRDSLVHQNSFP